jgi:hypothetical protein
MRMPHSTILAHRDSLASLAQALLALLFGRSGSQALGRFLVSACHLAMLRDVLVTMRLRRS